MSSPGSNSGDVFEIRKIRRLVELMNDHDLSEIDLRDGDFRIRLRKHQPGVAGGVPQVSVTTAPAVAPSSTTGQVEAGPAPSEEHITVIKSIMVGTFFAAPSPEAPPFVKVGDHVGPETTVCIIEAMKVFNEIPAGVSGQIVAVLVDSGDPVEFGQPLFKVDSRQ